MVVKAVCGLLVLASGCLVADETTPTQNNELKLGEALQAGIKQAEAAVNELGEKLKQALQDLKIPTTVGDSAPASNVVVKDARRRRALIDELLTGLSSSSSSESKETGVKQPSSIVETINVA